MMSAFVTDSLYKPGPINGSLTEFGNEKEGSGKSCE